MSDGHMAVVLVGGILAVTGAFSFAPIWRDAARERRARKHHHLWGKWRPGSITYVARGATAIPKDQQYQLTDKQWRECTTCGLQQWTDRA